PVEGLTDWKRLQEEMERMRRNTGATRSIDLEEMKAALKERVKGQDHVVDDLCRFVKLMWGKEKRKRPVANVLLVGPPGTGKSELAKALTEYLYGDEKFALFFDC